MNHFEANSPSSLRYQRWTSFTARSEDHCHNVRGWNSAGARKACLSPRSSVLLPDRLLPILKSLHSRTTFPRLPGKLLAPVGSPCCHLPCSHDSSTYRVGLTAPLLHAGAVEAPLLLSPPTVVACTITIWEYRSWHHYSVVAIGRHWFCNIPPTPTVNSHSTCTHAHTYACHALNNNLFMEVEWVSALVFSSVITQRHFSFIRRCCP